MNYDELVPPQTFISRTGCLYERIELSTTPFYMMWNRLHADSQWDILRDTSFNSQVLLVWCKARYTDKTWRKWSFREANWYAELKRHGFQSIKRSCPYATYRKLL